MNLRSRSLYAIARPSVCRLSRVHERYRNTTDGRAMIAYSERTELAKGHAEKKIILCARDSISSEQDAVSFPVSLRGLRTNVNVSSRSLKKAFDTVPHQRLLQKLQLLGFSGDVLRIRWIDFILTGRTMNNASHG